MSGSAFALTLMVPKAGFAVTAGEPVLGGMRAPELAHWFCPSCMSWVYAEPAGMDFVNVRATLLDDASWFAPFAETFTSEGLAWARTGAPKSYERFPSMDELGALLGAHAEWARARGWPVPSGG